LPTGRPSPTPDDRVRSAQLVEKGSDGRAQGRQGDLGDPSHPIMFYGGIAMDQQVSESNDLANFGDAACQNRIQLRQPAECLANNLELPLHRRMDNNVSE
jgi:hypothetical protein